MGIFSSIFGGGTSSASEKSADAQRAANAASLAFIKQQSSQARQDAIPLFQSAQDVAALGTQGALDVISGGLGAQLEAQNQGNFLAQQQLADTQPQFQNAILGLPTQQFQPQQAQLPDLSFLQGLQAPTASPFTGQIGGALGGDVGGDTGGSLMDQFLKARFGVSRSPLGLFTR